MAEQEAQPDKDRLEKRLADRRRLAAVSSLNNNDRELGTLLTDRQLDLFVIATDQEEGGLLSQYPPDTQVEILRKYHEIKEEKVDPYDLPPIEYNVEERYPDYFKALQEEERIASKLSEMPMYMANYGMGAPTLPLKPYGLNKSVDLAKMGYDPQASIDEYLKPELDIPNNPFSGKTALETDLIFNTRNMTTEQWQHLAERHGLDGEFKYIKPKDPSYGIVYRDRSSDEWVQVDTPDIEWADVYTGIGREIPALTLDILATGGVGSRIQPILKKIDKVKFGKPSAPLNRFFQITGVSAAAGGATALGEWIRMTTGHVMGANNLTFEEVTKESGIMALLAMGGTAVISTGMAVLPALWRRATGQGIPPETIRLMEKELAEAAASKEGRLSNIDEAATGGSRLSEKEITESIEEIVPHMMEHWNPTTGQITGSQIMIDLENAFLKGATDGGLIQTYQDIVEGNRRVIDAYVKEIARRSREKMLENAGDVTGAKLSIAIREQIEKDVEKIEDGMLSVIDSLVNRLGQISTEEGVGIAGKTLLRDVDASDLYEGGFQRFRNALNQAQVDHMKPFDDAVQEGIENTKWTVDVDGNPITIGTGKPLTDATRAWKEARKEADQMLKNPEAEEAVDAFYDMLGTYGNVTLNRLLGRETVTKKVPVLDEFGNPKINPKTNEPLTKIQTAGGKFQYSAFTMKELENARVTLNAIASNFVGKNLTAFRYARALERGIERQQHQLIRKAAKDELKLKYPDKRIGKKAVDDYVYHPRDNPDGTFGTEIYESWAIRNREFNKVHGDVINELIKKRPSKVVDYVLSSSPEGVGELIYLLEKQNLRGAILDIQKGISVRVRDILRGDGNPFAKEKDIATAYSKFVHKHKDILKEIYGDGFDPKFSTGKEFRRTVVKPLEIYEESIASIQKRFGTVGDPNPSTTNVIRGILNSSEDDISAGITLQKTEWLLPYINRDPILREQVAAEIQNVISEKILSRIKGRTGRTPDGAKIAELFDAYPTQGANTFDNVIGPLLGEGGPAHIHNLRVIDEMLQRNVDVPATPASKAATRKWVDIGINYLKRFFIKPLTQFGRRVTAGERLAGTKAERTMGELMASPKMLDDLIKFTRGRIKKQMFMQSVIAWGIATGNTDIAEEIGNDLDNYSAEKLERTDTEIEREDSGALESLYDNLYDQSPYLTDPKERYLDYLDVL